MDFAAIVTNVVAAFAHVGGQALDAAQTTAEALLIALTIIAALFQTSKLVTVYRGGTQLSGASVLYDPLYETRTRSLPASAPTASIAVPLRAGDDYPPIPLHETIRLAFMLFTLVLIVCAVVCQAVSNVTDRPNGSKPADRVARPTRRRILDLVPQQLPDEFPTVQGLNFVESPLVEFYIVDPLEDIPPSSSSTSNPAASSVVKTTPESQEQTKHDEPAPLPIPVDDPTRLAKKQRRKERQTAKKALLLKPITTQHPYSPDSGLAPSSSW
ncbi:uncharacterized protein SCHCODRAFT_02099734 [Schizophyllum commune H4-8]|uniref:uncharacterized protein n=1 Tax=Schizophyllum commune (strain H4-8 / FGSC 9210) TaxID=578458 RepID=UPI0021604C2B|nr:uncharacterized protein SCHCODRAFT_02099734 [Schizophyllum commune H4-8]KAI5886480.1 hypothetical protein SCHCODRAFT_02099734 [Schizophyllum commune H4-8]